MGNLAFALNTTMPLFLLMLLGALFKKLKWMDEAFAAKLNKFVFLVPLPVMLFKDLAAVDLSQSFNVKFVLFCFGATLLSIVLAFLISLIFKKDIRGEFIQGSYRSSAAILGIALISNIYGNAGMGPMMILGSVPLYNIFAVLVLTVFKPLKEGEKVTVGWPLLKKTLIGVVTNPILIGILIGFIWSAFHIPMPTILSKTVNSVAATATPLGLIAMGVIFDFKKATGKIGPALTATFIKLFGFAIVFLPLAVLFGFRNEELIAILVMLGSATTVSSFVMSKNMGHEGTLTSSVVMLTTLFAAFSLTFWLWLLKTLALI